MFAIVSHNAVGTFYRAVYGFASVEAAREYIRRWYHTGIGDVVIAESDLPEYERINDRWSDAARRLQK